MLTTLAEQLKKLSLRRIASLPVLLMSVLALPICLLPLYPPTAWDAIMYHLPYARIYLRHHGLTETPYLLLPVSSQNNDLLFALALLFYDDLLAHLIEFLILITLTAAVVAFGQRYFSARAGWWGAGIWLTNPLVIWLGTCAYVDLGVSLFMVMTAYAFCLWAENKQLTWLMLAGVFCGLAIGTKLLALFLLLIPGLYIFWLSLKDRKFALPVLFGLICLLIASPWLIRSYYYTGSSLYPLIQASRGHAVRAVEKKSEYARPGLAITSYLPSRERPWSIEKLTPLLTLPFDVFFNRSRWNPPAPLSPLYGFALPLLLLGIWKLPRIRGLLASILIYLLCWFLTIQDLRYAVPALPLLSVVTAVCLELFVFYLPQAWQPRLKSSVITFAVFALLFVPASLYAAWRMKVQGRLPVTTRQRGDYLSKEMPSSSAYQFLNQKRGSDYTIYAVDNSRMVYLAAGNYIGDLGISYESLLQPLQEGQPVNGETLYQRLRQKQVTHFLLNENHFPLALPQDQSFARHFRLIYEQPGLWLFELQEQTSSSH